LGRKWVLISESNGILFYWDAGIKRKKRAQTSEGVLKKVRRARTPVEKTKTW